MSDYVSDEDAADGQGVMPGSPSVVVSENY